MTIPFTLAAAPDLAPVAAGIALVAVILLPVAFFIAALVGILGSELTGGMKLVWTVFAFCAPFLGPLLWFLVGRKQNTTIRG
ncbi:PLDc N-terminal domain-containing protein [Amycolatopsis sp. PS_44_ISF1]|uniref:PLDc N-terminal domain-containing protein n=1 Tax=Amycolatopsis sp. PS_44_ISF1 TaxID=2974917 RepID=UPI0028DE1241|nr:PLDc N-terminal domain-containing protein [Amycolatopsis sp. PS_44_ISF1]MDT8911897.1 PLD nuclease N-terminal domain-containing protein [Amycolatopsis sp. PS_44_ISF1]